MKPSDEFFKGQRYAVFGVAARGRAQGPVLLAALKKAGKAPFAILPDGSSARNAEAAPSLAAVWPVDGAVVLPPDPWDDAAADFTADAVRQCQECGLSEVWIYVPGDPAPAMALARNAGLNPSENRCPCLHIEGCGFPHNLHRFLLRLSGQR